MFGRKKINSFHVIRRLHERGIKNFHRWQLERMWSRKPKWLPSKIWEWLIVRMIDPTWKIR